MRKDILIVDDEEDIRELISGILQDEGYLTDVRTAVAGAICAKYLAPKHVETIGIVGTGVQARMQLDYLDGVINYNNVFKLNLFN